MAKTLEPIALSKMGRRFADSIDHAGYTLNGEPRTIPIFRKLVDGSIVKLYVYFDDTFVGTVKGVQLVDTDGDVVAFSDREFTKPANKGLYVAFKYRFREKEVENVEKL